MLITELMVLSTKAEGHYKKGILIGEGGSNSAFSPREMPNCIKGALKRSQDLGWSAAGNSNVG